MRNQNVFATVLASSAVLAHAEDKRADDANLLDTIEVTGSHIRGVDLETQRAMQILLREDLERSGVTAESMTGSPHPARLAGRRIRRRRPR